MLFNSFRLEISFLLPYICRQKLLSLRIKMYKKKVSTPGAETLPELKNELSNRNSEKNGGEENKPSTRNPEEVWERESESVTKNAERTEIEESKPSFKNLKRTWEGTDKDNEGMECGGVKTIQFLRKTDKENEGLESPESSSCKTKKERERRMKCIRFDWAMKRLLRDKANYVVLEGLLTCLLGREIRIHRMLESESNQEDEFEKNNRVDLLAEDADGELVIVEVQNESEFAYFQRMLFGTSKLVTEYIERGSGYEDVKKIYSINIVYFNLGNGKDTVYHGKTEFYGLHNGELLSLSPFQKQKFNAEEVSDLYPEYYILKVNDFNKWSKTPLEQWLYFLNSGDIPDDASAPGLKEARKKLALSEMDKAEREAYYKHLDNRVILKDNIITARGEGRLEGIAEGIKEGIEKGRAEEKKDTAAKLKSMGLTLEQIAEATGLSAEEIKNL